MELPAHLRTLARVDGEDPLDVDGQVTQRSVLDALEAGHPTLRGTIRDRLTERRRPFLRFLPVSRIVPTSRQTLRGLMQSLLGGNLF